MELRPQPRRPPPTVAVPPCRLDRGSIRAACDASLRRLQTTYIDLYQLHWPDRYVPLFGQLLYDFGKERDVRLRAARLTPSSA